MAYNLSPGAAACKTRMEAEQLPSPVIKNFLRLYHQIEDGETGTITEAEIAPVPELDHYSKIASDQKYQELGRAALDKLVVCKLNGGLGTGMGLERAKSLLPVKQNLTFNHLIAEQLRHYCTAYGQQIPLLHMTSFSTDADLQEFMQGYPDLQIAGLETCFQQHKHPKVYCDTLLPGAEPEEALNWNPPGHGDLYPALISTGTLDRLIAAGKRYIFVSNSDNLGATPDLSILGYIIAHNLPFLMEVAERTPADSKGGHLALRCSDNRLILREAAQAPLGPDGAPCAEFQDISRYRYFNSNSEWGDLLAWRSAAEEHGGVIPLPLIRNKKNINPRDSRSRAVFQIETAMGAAIEVFPGAGAIVIPRSRFSPVKATVDLLAVRSDAYVLKADHSLGLATEREAFGPPLVNLDGRYYKMVDDFNLRFRQIPSMLNCRELTVEGNIAFHTPLKLSGRVTITDRRSSRDKVTVFPAEETELANESFEITD